MINVTGVSESRVAPAAAYYANQKDQSIIIVSTDVRAKRLASDLSFFVQDKEIITLPEEEQFLLRYAAKNQDHMLTRLRALKALRTGQPVVVIAPASAAVKKSRRTAASKNPRSDCVLGKKSIWTKSKASWWRWAMNAGK